MIAAATDGHLFWITSRAAGTAALLFSSAGMCVGLLIGGRLVKGRGLDLRALHEALSLATLGALVLHAVSLLGDGFLSPSLADIAIPLASSYRQPWMAVGVLGGWAMLLLGLSYYARARIGVQRWRRLHRLTAVAWLAGLAHSLAMGTDAGRVWFLLAIALVAVPVLVLLVARLSIEEAPAR